ncbi:hypothetical protein GCM10007913_40420 [Devosia yakushimensis]|uniref:RidA family protein n=1 Tax=Devosia yakushimensis TaxID=470028 RepID=A0ABQ5UJU7_9HYPH|nr:Rid family hydrolase [Devosia yakushimensis]GLQ12110.1 hypothetical protein GCM10007913_40420 [Devosia yakushimensis]
MHNLQRFPGLTSTRSRAVATDTTVYTVAVAPTPVPEAIFDEAMKVFERIEESLTLCGTEKANILAINIFLSSLDHKEEFNRAWDAWIGERNQPMRCCFGVDISPPHRVELVVTAAR